jgi:hypothetical protein
MDPETRRFGQHHPTTSEKEVELRLKPNFAIKAGLASVPASVPTGLDRQQVKPGKSGAGNLVSPDISEAARIRKGRSLVNDQERVARHLDCTRVGQGRQESTDVSQVILTAVDLRLEDIPFIPIPTP